MAEAYAAHRPRWKAAGVFADYFGRHALGAIRGSFMPAQLGMNAFGPVLAGAAYDLTGVTSPRSYRLRSPTSWRP